MDTDGPTQLIILVILIMLSAIFSSAETAFMSCNKIRLMNMKDDGDKKAALVLEMLEKQNKLISALLIGNNIVNIAASSIATKLAIDIFGSVGVGIATGIMTLLLLVFGEVMPKNLAAAHAVKWAMIIAPFIRFISVILSPFVFLMTKLSDFVVKISKGSSDDYTITEDELKLLVNVGQEEGVLDETESDMLNSIFDLDEIVVKEIMVPRIDMVAIDGEDSLSEAIELIVDAGHSRIPVYEESIDNIVGVLYAKDIFNKMGEDFDNLKIKEVIRPAYYIPENKKVNDLLTELRSQKVHMAIILDEYGGTAGVVTIEDLIEQIVGDIQDEFDSEEDVIVMHSDEHLVADGRALVDEVAEAFDIELPEIEESDAETIGGLVFEQLGGIPKVNDEVVIDRLRAKVVEVSNRRIAKLEIFLLPAVDEEEETEEKRF